MAIIYNNDKRSGITYAYESHSYWDKEKKMSRSKRTLIGRVDPETGEIKPTDGRCRKNSPYAKDDPSEETLIRERLKGMKVSELKSEIVRLEIELKKAEKHIGTLQCSHQKTSVGISSCAIPPQVGQISSYIILLHVLHHIIHLLFI